MCIFFLMWLQMGPFLVGGHMLPEKQGCLVFVFVFVFVLVLYLSSICLVFDVVTNGAIPYGWASVTREASLSSICICICIV